MSKPHSNGRHPPIGPNAMQEAAALHQQGQLAEAERIYAAIVACMPDHFDALHLLGVLRQEQSRPAEALSLIAAALRLNARSAEAHANYGVVLDGLDRHAEALESFERALALDPAHAGARAGRDRIALRHTLVPASVEPAR